MYSITNRIWKSVMLAILVQLLTFKAMAQPPNQYANNRLLVQFTENAKPKWNLKRGVVTTGYEMLDAVNVKYICVKATRVNSRRTKKAPNLYLLQFKDSINVHHAIKEYHNTKLFKFVEPEYKVIKGGS